jgi:protein SCO1/2
VIESPRTANKWMLNHLAHPTRFVRSLVLIVFCLLAGCSQGSVELHGSPYQAPKPAPEFTLSSTTGSDFHLDEQRGRLVLLYFGYTFCPDICPATLAELHQVLQTEQIGPDQAIVVMITVDPDRDSLSHLSKYLARFDPEFIGLRAEGETLESVLAAYGVYAEKDPDSDPGQYLVTHTARVFLIDAQGFLRTNYSFGTPIEDIQIDLQNLKGSGK